MLELIRNAEVFSPEPLGRRDILVAAGKILWIGSGLPSLPAGLEVRERDLAGLRVLPGLIDGHVHLTGGGGEAGMRSRVPSLALSEITRAGTTTIVGLLGTDDTTRSPASLLAAVRALDEQGLSARCYVGGYHLPVRTLTGSVRDDVVFLEPVIGVGELAISDHRSSQPSLAEILRVASEVHVGGMMTGKAGVVHLHVGAGRRGLTLIREALAASEIPPRVFYPTHVNRRRALFEEALELARTGCVIDVTAGSSRSGPGAPRTTSGKTSGGTTGPISGTTSVDRAPPGDEPVPAAEAIGRYLDAGLPPERITASSDAGGSLPRFDANGRVSGMGVGRPEALGETLRELLRSGRPLEQVLPVFTRNAADHLRLPFKGRIAPGADADLVALDGAGNVVHVLARGRWHVWQGEAAVLGDFETR
jgi:beta-aspartyl-dipeptidase (metallo-type)